MVPSACVVGTARRRAATYGGAEEREIRSTSRYGGSPVHESSASTGSSQLPPRPMIIASRAGSIAERGRYGARVDPGGRAERYRSMV